MIEVIGVRFKTTNKIYYFDPLDIELELKDKVIVETIRGQEYASVVLLNKKIEESDLEKELKPVIRRATDEDKIQYEKNIEDAKEAFDVCLQKIEEHGLPMVLLESEYTFDRSKLLFYFSSENRVDFRLLVRDLASIFKTRIELRQIGVRDEARHLGGYGICGRPYCCKNWLDNFNSVSIKMVKDQGLSLNPSKISGSCGRLFCCLKFEQENYEGLLKIMPPIGSIVKTPDGIGKVIQTQMILREVKVLFEKNDNIDFHVFSADEVKVIKRGNTVDENREKDASNEELKTLED